MIISRETWEVIKIFQGAHTGDITDFSWSANGAYLASSASDGTVVLWETTNQTVVARYEHRNVISLAWHPSINELSFATNEGTIVTHPGFVPAGRPSPVGRIVTIFEADGVNRERTDDGYGYRMNQDEHSLLDDASEDWIDDDDHQGYAENGNLRKRTYADIDGEEPLGKVSRITCKRHEPFQPGSTPWKGGRRYLVLNLVGFVWSVDQETHNTVTIEFFDQETNRSIHFTDHFKFDKACLNENAAFFSSPKSDLQGSRLFYRAHSTWATRADWSIDLPAGEEALAIGLSHSFAVVCTSKQYVRVYTSQGMPVRMYRQKQSSVVACATWRDYVMILSNGPLSYDGLPSITYSIDNIRQDEILQEGDTVGLPSFGTLQSVFFSEDGDPMTYDSTGVLSVLLHWRLRAQAKWIPLLDTTLLERRMGKQESYWPVAVADQKFHCIILKGGERHPYFPRPILSEFQFAIPLAGTKKQQEDAEEQQNQESVLEERFVRESVLYELREDMASTTTLNSEDRAEHARRQATLEKTLLQLIQTACRDDREERALNLVGLLKRKTSMEAASRIALHHGKTTLGERINDLRFKMEQQS